MIAFPTIKMYLRSTYIQLIIDGMYFHVCLSFTKHPKSPHFMIKTSQLFVAGLPKTKPMAAATHTPTQGSIWPRPETSDPCRFSNLEVKWHSFSAASPTDQTRLTKCFPPAPYNITHDQKPGKCLASSNVDTTPTEKAKEGQVCTALQKGIQIELSG